jgi:4-diphosphocytidyl-2-C-methyl-D-erythritol kinase
LHALAASLGADVPFFLEPGPKLAEGTGERLRPLELPQDFWVVLALPRELEKGSTGEVYARFDALGGGPSFHQRKDALLQALARVRRSLDLEALPSNDLAEASGASPLAAGLRDAGAFRADVSGAGPAVYGLFETRREARAAARRLGRGDRVWVAAPVW